MTKLLIDLSNSDISSVLTEGIEHTVIRPLSDREVNLDMNLNMMTAATQWMFNQIREIKDFTLMDEIIVIIRPNPVSIFMLMALSQAFNNIKVWSVETYFGKSRYIDLGMAFGLGWDFAMTKNRKGGDE